MLVAVIEEDSSVRGFLDQVLKNADVRVWTAGSLVEALTRLETQPPEVVYTALRLPDGSGLQVLQQARQQHSAACIVFAEQASTETAIEALRLGACDYVTKPLSSDKILSALNRAKQMRNINSCSVRHRVPKRGKAPGRTQMVAVSPQMRNVLQVADEAARDDFPLLIQGEAGVGKKRLARWIHARGLRPDGPLVHVVCDAACELSRRHDVLSWHETGPHRVAEQKQGFGSARGATILLENVAALPKWAQVQLLDCIEAGWDRNDPPDMRVIGTTSENLEDACDRGDFHRGLFDYLDLLPIRIPPLRRRPDDLRALVNHYLEVFCRRRNCDSRRLRSRMTEEFWQLLLDYGWPGNVRELCSIVARIVLFGDTRRVEAALRKRLTTSGQTSRSAETISIPLSGDLKTIERHVVREIIRRHGGNKSAAARALGMHRRTLYRVLDAETN